MSFQSEDYTSLEPVAAEERESVSRNVLFWLNKFPQIPEEVLLGNPLAPINFEVLKDNTPSMVLSTVPGAYIISKDILGSYTAQYLFKVAYRIIPGITAGPDKRLKAEEILNRLSFWCEKTKPDLGPGIRNIRVKIDIPASLHSVNENGDEDFQIFMTLTYEVI